LWESVWALEERRGGDLLGNGWERGSILLREGFWGEACIAQVLMAIGHCPVSV
jgi:hypothetical protein